MHDPDNNPTLPAESATDDATLNDAEAVGFDVSKIPSVSAEADGTTLPGAPDGPAGSGDAESTDPQQLGRYKVRGRIGRGGVGEVLRGFDPELGRDVALKRLRHEMQERSGLAERFLEEAQITGQLQHPGVLPVFELARDGEGRLFFAMKLVRGETLAELLDRRDDPSQERARWLGIFEKICQTVAYAHAKGVIHRDLKPSNVMVGAFGEVQVLDWGLAKVLGEHEPSEASAVDTLAPIHTVRSADDSSQSLAGAVMGTPAYMPPEQARGEIEHLDARSDVFCLGGILGQILTGHAPYDGAAEKALDRAAGAELGPLRDRLERCGADAELVTLANACLAANPPDRPSDAGEVARWVAAYRTSLEARAHASELAAAEARATAREERRARRLTLALASAVLVAVVLGVAGYLALRHQKEQARTRQAEVIDGAMERFAELLQRNHASPTDRGTDWRELEVVAARLRSSLPTMDDPEIRQRAVQVIADFDRAENDRGMVQDLERLTAVGASYDDLGSWVQMAEELAAAFARHGLDPGEIGGEEVVRRIRASPISEELAFGLDLWIRTETLLTLQGVGQRSMPELIERLDLVLAADPDPLRVRLRRLTFAQASTAESLLAEVRHPDFATLPASSLVLLASAFSRVDYPVGWEQVCREGLLRFPNHFRLNESCAYALRRQGQWVEAARIYTATAALRPQIGGLWRSLGVSLVHAGDVPGGVAALHKSLRLDPGTARNHLDLAWALLALGEVDPALASVDEALHIDPDLAPATALRVRLLSSLGRSAEAAEARALCRQQIASGDRFFDSITPDPGSENWRELCQESNHPTRP